MKAKIALFIPTLALFGAAVLATPKVAVAYAEGDEPLTSESVSAEEEVSSEASSQKGFDIDAIVIDGKTIEQWKNELRDENTRSAAIIGLIAFSCGGLLFVLKWLKDHGMLKKTFGVVSDTKEYLKEKQEELEKAKKDFDEKRGAFEQYVSEKEKYIEGKISELEEKGKAYHEESAMGRAMLETILKTDPTLVKNGAYEEAKKAMEAIKNGKE